MNMNDLFFELSHEGRCRILEFLVTGKKKHAQIEAELGIVGAEVSRHLKRLQNTHLVEKSPDGMYGLTSFGEATCSLFPFFENSLKFVDFINAHDFRSIPPYIMLQLESSPDVEVRTGTINNIEMWTELITRAQSYIWAITDQLQTSMVPLIRKKLESGTELEIRAIVDRKLLRKFSESSVLPFDPDDMIKRVDLFENVRIQDETSISLTITERGALIFLRSDDHVDYSQGMFSESPTFIGWAKKIFKLCWEQGHQFNHSDLSHGKSA
ncbi:MAG: helix-turn-helix transcriptional regulator [Promethearchaeota archaeon]